MAEHSRTLHYDRETQTSGVRLYTTQGDVTNPTVITTGNVENEGTLSTTAADDITPALRLMDGNTTVYASLAEVSGTAEGLMASVNGKNYVAPYLPAKGKALNQYTWKEISYISRAGKGAEYFNIGDCKEITLNGKVGDYLTLTNEKLCVFILDFNHQMNGTAENNIIFGGFKTALTNGVDVALCDSQYGTNPASGTIAFNMDHWWDNTGYGSNFGGWKGCDLRYDILGATSRAPSQYGSIKTTANSGYDATAATLLNPKTNTLLAALPSDFRNALRLWTRYVDNKGNSSNTDANVTACIDAGISLLTEPEIFTGGTQGSAGQWANKYEKNYNTRMAYYANGNGTVKKKHSNNNLAVDWFESSPRYNSAWAFCSVATNGSGDGKFAYRSYGLAPAFKI